MDYINHFLYPGELLVSRKPVKVTTILGSCVSVCFFDPATRVGGINHFMLPTWNGRGLSSPRYGEIAIERLWGKMHSLGARRNTVQAKIFGGAEVIMHSTNHLKVGARNITIARQILEEMDISIVSSSTSGLLGRKILFFTDTGKVLHRFIQKTS